MRRTAIGISLVGGVLLSFALLGASQVRAERDGRDDDDSRVRQGFRIAPVRLNLRNRNLELVGTGSYLVNAVGSCADCHSCPTYTPGHNPYGPPFGPPGGGDGQFNPVNYLAGGVLFAPPGVTSANITPDANGRPAGLTFLQFAMAIRMGHDPDDPHRILQVMPWPVLRHMTDQDLRAIYEYLRAIPHAEHGTCVAPGQ